MLALLSFQLPAAQMPELYRASVPVNSQGSKERGQAMETALSEVLVKVTGQQSNTVNNPGVKRALEKASALVQSFGYEHRDTDTGQPLVLQVRFDETAINQLLHDNGLGIWDANRPDTIVWLAIEQQGNRQILREAAGSLLVNDLKQAMAARSLPLTFPLMDFEDSTTISDADVWGLFSNKLNRASARYGSEAILAGRLHEVEGRFNGRIILFFRDQRFDATVTDLSAGGLALAITNLTGNTLARHYAVLSGSNSINPVLEVNGIASARDYAGVVNYLKGLTAVRNVTVIKVNKHTIKLELKINGTLSQLSDAIALGRNLRATGKDELNQTLKYRWLSH